MAGVEHISAHFGVFDISMADKSPHFAPVPPSFCRLPPRRSDFPANILESRWFDRYTVTRSYAALK